jgi:hypothetical protein
MHLPGQFVALCDSSPLADGRSAMSTKIRPGDAGVPELNDWLEMNNWIVELRDDSGAESAFGDDAESAVGGDAEPANNGDAEPANNGDAEPAVDRGPKPGTAADTPPADMLTVGTEIDARAKTTERAAIGDKLRMPIAWCEMSSCVSYHADPATLGEADIRARAISAGWRVDALGRLACPECQQSRPGFWASHPVALWDRDTAIVRATLMAAAIRKRRHCR